MSYSNRHHGVGRAGTLSGFAFADRNKGPSVATVATPSGAANTTPAPAPAPVASSAATSTSTAATAAAPSSAVVLSSAQKTAMNLDPVSRQTSTAISSGQRSAAVATAKHVAVVAEAAPDRSAAATFASVFAAECAGVFARDQSLPQWEPPPALIPAGAFVAYVAAVVRWDDASAGSAPFNKLMREMQYEYPGGKQKSPGYQKRWEEAAKRPPVPSMELVAKLAPNIPVARTPANGVSKTAWDLELLKDGWRFSPIYQEGLLRQMPGVAGTVADISGRIESVSTSWFERAGDASSRGALVTVVQLRKEASTEALTAWVQVNLAEAMRDNGMGVGGTVLPLPVLLSFKSWADKDAQAQIADAVERVRRSLGQLATAFKVKSQGITALRKKLDDSALKLRKVVDEIQAGITTAAGVQAFVAGISGGVPSMVAEIDALPATVTEIAQLEGARASLANAAKAIDTLEAKIAKDAAAIQLAISRGPTIGQEMTALKTEYTPAKVIAIAMPEAEALASRAPFAEQAERVRCSAMRILQQEAGNAFDSLQRATAAAVQISAALDVPSLTASLGALGGLGSAVAELRAAVVRASAALDAKEKELGLDFYLRNFYGLPVWAWGAGGAALLVGGALFLRARKKKAAASAGQK